MKRRYAILLVLVVFALCLYLADNARDRRATPAHGTAAPSVQSVPKTHPTGASPNVEATARQRHSQLAHAIARAREQSGPRTRGETASDPPAVGLKRGQTVAALGQRSAGTPALDKEYIRGRVREIIPLVQECYENELPEEGRPAGDLLLHFTLEGEPGVGGIVGESEVTGGSLAKHAGLVECVVETMFTLEFEPPAEGGEVTVDYPLRFAPSDAVDEVRNPEPSPP